MIKYYIIHCVDNAERMNYIHYVKLKLGQPLELFNGINTRNVNIHNAMNIMKMDYIKNFINKNKKKK